MTHTASKSRDPKAGGMLTIRFSFSGDRCRSIVGRGGRNKASPSSLADSWDCDDCDTDVLIDCTAKPFAVPPIAAAYAADGDNPRTSATDIAMIVRAQHTGIFTTVPEEGKIFLAVIVHLLALSTLVVKMAWQ